MRLSCPLPSSPSYCQGWPQRFHSLSLRRLTLAVIPAAATHCPRIISSLPVSLGPIGFRSYQVSSRDIYQHLPLPTPVTTRVPRARHHPYCLGDQPPASQAHGSCSTSGLQPAQVIAINRTRERLPRSSRCARVPSPNRRQHLPPWLETRIRTTHQWVPNQSALPSTIGTAIHRVIQPILRGPRPITIAQRPIIRSSITSVACMPVSLHPKLCTSTYLMAMRTHKPAQS